jgi:hypothetical protein
VGPNIFDQLHGAAELDVRGTIRRYTGNFIKIHSTLCTSPAMAAGVSKWLFDVRDLVNLLIESETTAA